MTFILCLPKPICKLSMSKLFGVIKILMLSVVAMSYVPCMGQDLLAKQAPIDRKMKAVDSVAVLRLIKAERAQTPGADLYSDWDNQYVNTYKNTVKPENFKIDLRGFCMPTTSRQVTSNYGYRRSFRRNHYGLDVKVYIGDTIVSAFSGRVRVVRYDRGGYGKFVVIRHDNGLETVYGHLSKQLVEVNDYVKAGEPIGLGGNTGRSTGSHLHFETRFLGEAINPALMFDFANQDIKSDFYVFHKTRSVTDDVLAMNGDEEELEDNETVQPTASVPRFHKVKKGETLAVIARKRHVTVAQLCRLNRMNKKTRLRPGQLLKYS